MDKFRKCIVEGCDKNSHHLASGVKKMCAMHYNRVKSHGSPHIRLKRYGDATAFLEELVSSDSRTDECIIWPFACDTNGYGRFYTARNSEFPTITASRYVCFRVHGPPPTLKYHAAHSCGNGSGGCVNPSHLSWKTAEDNLKDKIGHGTHMYGDAHPSTKYSDETIREIRRGNRTTKEICDHYGISFSHARKIMKGLCREWVKDD